MIVAFTGHRELGGSYELNPISKWVKSQMRTLLLELKPSKILTGMAIGTDTIAAELAIELGIPFIAVIPFIGQEKIWPKPSQDFYHSLIKMADDLVIVCDRGFAAWKMMKRNQYLVDNSDLLISVWDGKKLGGTYNCVKYAETKGKEIIRINPNDYKEKE